MAPSRLLSVSALLLSLSTSALAATTYAVIDWSKVPSCAKKCTVLTSAEAACIPPQQPVTSQNAYQSCFCTATSLSGLYSSSNAVCTNVCSASTDLEELKDWYVNLCTAGVVVTPGVAAPAAATATTGAGASAATGSSSLQTGSAKSSGGGNTWISTHWRWVIMLVVVFFGMISLAVLGVCLKRRYRRKHDAEGANVAARGAPVLDPATVNASNHQSRPSEMSMANSGTATPVTAMGALPRPPRTLGRSRSNTAGTAGSRGSGIGAPWAAQNPIQTARGYNSSSGDSLDKDIPTDLPAPAAAYAAGDLPERQYSPVVSRRSSAHVGNPGRPSSTQIETTAAAAAAVAAMKSNSNNHHDTPQHSYANYDRHQNTPPTQPSPTLPPEDMFLPMHPPSRPSSRPGSSNSPVNFSRPPLGSRQNSDGAGAQRIREMQSQGFESGERDRVESDAQAAAQAAVGDGRPKARRLSKRGRQAS